MASAEGDVKVVTLRGELDFDEAPALERVLAELRGAGAREIVVDVCELMFIDSSGISALVAAARATSADRGSLVVASPTPHVQRVFDIVRLAELVGIEESLDSALQRIGWRREQSAG